jgi:outer membrane protein OmpA-like peptidoglycan-associated protein
VAAVLLVCAAASGQPGKVYAPGERPDPADVERLLSPADPTPTAPQGQRGSRGQRTIKKVAPSDSAVPPDTATAAPDSPRQETRRLAVQLPFEFDSARLTPAATAQLDAIAEGMKRLSGPVRIALEGHTDASGSDAYNDALSLRRAAAVRDFLVAQGLPAQWFEVRGEGRRRPLDGADPKAAENRRVEFRRLP